MKSLRSSSAAIMLVAVLACGQWAGAAPVGLLESVDVQVLQGGQSLFHFTNVSTVGSLNGQDIYLGTLSNGTIASLRIIADQAGTAEVEDRWMQFTIRGTDANGAGANLFNPDLDGPIEVKLTNMKFSNVDGVNGNRVAPFKPGEYVPYPLTELPFFYLLDEYRGFVNLPGSEKYSPGEAPPYNLGGGAWPSVQVPMRIWADPAWGYGFTQVDNGHLTGFELSGIPDFGGTGVSRDGALALTPVLDSPAWPNYFGVTSVPAVEDRGFVSEIGIDLNFRGYIVPEPATLLLLLAPMFVWRAHRTRERLAAS
ncbi:MAG TPA: hypothetical protein PL151_02690 [Phycisphaerae bacterium]|nr:hypothetical protein [Phycisphaerae bacterium]HOJ73683.1 hypothetical protein [Phycisphaerae bacterium]HOM50330.1 hypothetical protein [Phycisphaerae bacterium]HON65944.1 hypothetical protein [Phycisphaerae bacterium]HOQ84957.1 hypothetical protein [Phycisphaerae bacterium]